MPAQGISACVCRSHGGASASSKDLSHIREQAVCLCPCRHFFLAHRDPVLESAAAPLRLREGRVVSEGTAVVLSTRHAGPARAAAVLLRLGLGGRALRPRPQGGP